MTAAATPSTVGTRHTETFEDQALDLRSAEDADIDLDDRNLLTQLGRELAWAVRPPAPPLARRALWRSVDLTLSTALLTLAGPGILAVSLLVRGTSTGPALFRHRRVGRSGQAFGCLKFRSMHVDAEERLDSLLQANADFRKEFTETYKLEQDPRVTPVGRVLRRYNLDELPQLLNVFSGNMSLVGPRPVTYAELPRFGEPALRNILALKPGMTGLWQVSGRNSLPYGERVQLEHQYSTSKSLRGDLKICWRTLVTMLTGTADGV